MKPSPNEVAKTIASVLNARWPAPIDEALHWLQAMGIQTGSAKETPQDGSSRSWQMAPVPAWGTASGGWSTYRDEFADVCWFLWERESSEDVTQAAAALAGAITDGHGAATESSAATPFSAASWWWQLEQHCIEMYAHHDLPNPNGHPTGPPCVQLHISLRARAEPPEPALHPVMLPERRAP